jgi:acetyltransferase-like isoleucine patch superfamily enzyme
MKKIIRILFMPFGFIKKAVELANDGARDIENKIRFKKAIIEKGCSFDSKSIIHPHVHLLENCIINNSEIHSYTYLGKNCLVQNTSIGKFCSIANDVLIGLGNHPLDLLSTSPLFYRINNPLHISLMKTDRDIVEYKPISIGNDVWIGTRSIIMDGVSIGHGAVIAANSAVTKDVPPYAVVGGVPAKIIKYRFPAEKIASIIKSKWWDLSIEKICIINRDNTI